MSAKAVREGDAKALLNRFIQHQFLKKLNTHIYDPRYSNELRSTFSIESVVLRTNTAGSTLYLHYHCTFISTTRFTHLHSAASEQFIFAE